MKKIYFLFIAVLTFSVSFSQSTRTTIANGLATNPFIWDCTCIPFPGDHIVVNHSITLNADFPNWGGSVLINAGGKVVGDNPMRWFSTNGTFTNHGEMYIARTGFFGGNVSNTGYIYSDSMITTTTAPFVNSGTIEIGTHFWNTAGFYNIAGGEMVVTQNFYNGDSLITGVTASFVNDGKIRVIQDFANADTLKGNGQICIDGASYNLGIITGTLDFCDLTGGNIDVNFGTVGGSVQFCQGACTVGTEEQIQAEVSIYPNPVSDAVNFSANIPFALRVFDLAGREVFVSSQVSGQMTIDTEQWAPGVYVYSMNIGGFTRTGKLVR